MFVINTGSVPPLHPPLGGLGLLMIAMAMIHWNPYHSLSIHNIQKVDEHIPFWILYRNCNWMWIISQLCHVWLEHGHRCHSFLWEATWLWKLCDIRVSKSRWGCEIYALILCYVLQHAMIHPADYPFMWQNIYAVCDQFCGFSDWSYSCFGAANLVANWGGKTALKCELSGKHSWPASPKPR